MTVVWTLNVHHEPVSVVRLRAGEDLPSWADGLPLTTVTWTERATTVICPTRSVPDQLPGLVEGPFVVFEVDQEVVIGTPGVLQALTRPLAEAHVAVFAVSTYHSHWLLVRAQDAHTARASWAGAGHILVDVTRSAAPAHGTTDDEPKGPQ